MLPLEILLGFLSPIERNHVVDVEVVVARGSRELELRELLLSVVLRCLLAKMPRDMVKSLSGCWCRALDLHVLGGDGVDADVTLPEMVARRHVLLSVFSKMRKTACRT